MKIIQAHWPAPNWVHAFTTTRESGFSKKPFDKGNVAHHVGDDIVSVTLNRLKLAQQFNLKSKTTWLNQTHSDTVVALNPTSPQFIEADGVWTRYKNLPCIIMTADCLPLLLTDEGGQVVGAIHCGWQGLAKGIIPRAIEQMMPFAQGNMIAWMGPAIGPSHFEVGKDVYDIFVNQDYANISCFTKTHKHNKWMLDLYQLATRQLFNVGIKQTFGGGHCTFSETNTFYSYRKESRTGRMASVIWF